MKTLLINAYSKLRTSLDRDIEGLVRQAGIVRYGDHFVCGRLLNSESVVIDLGANRGSFSEKIAHAFHPIIYLVEANLDLLQKIAIPRSVPVNAAITTSNSEMTFFVSSNPEASSLDKNLAGQYGIIEERRVECITFSTLLSKYNIKEVELLKVDIEGAEVELLQKMTDDELLKCKQLAVEFHDFMLPGTLNDVKSIANRLRDLGFIQFKFSPLDWRRVSFVQQKSLPVSLKLNSKFRYLTRLSRLLDFSYYRLLLPLNSALRGRK